MNAPHFYCFECVSWCCGSQLDTLVPITDCQHFVREVANHRVRTPIHHPDVYIELPGAHHAFNYLLSARTLSFGDAAVDFATSVYKRYLVYGSAVTEAVGGDAAISKL